MPYVESFVWRRSSLEGVEPLRWGAGKEENPIQTTCPKEEYKDKDKDDWIDKIKEIEQWREENPI